MYRKQLSRYLNMPPGKQPEMLVGTRNGYEFTMTALRLAGEWYVLIEEPDWTRLNDIDQVIGEEFDAKVLGWCVLKERQEEIGAIILPFEQGEGQYGSITYRDGSNFCWLLKV